jgi:hypothetical protein
MKALRKPLPAALFGLDERRAIKWPAALHPLARASHVDFSRRDRRAAARTKSLTA